jgi:hypothetical protein
VGQTTDELRAEVEERREDVSRDLEAIGDRLSPGRMIERRSAAVRGRFTQARNAVMGTADSATSSVRGATGSASDSIRETAGSAKDAITRAPGAAGQEMLSRTEGNPLAAGLIAFGAGLLAATLIPPSEREQQLAAKAEPGLRTAVDELKAGASDAVEQVKPVAEEAAQRVKDDAKEAVDSVKEQARSGAETMREEARSRTETMREPTTPPIGP